MKKVFILLAFIVAAFLQSHAQSIVAAEYFFDSPDPGIGLATQLLFSSPSEIVNQTFSVSTGSLPAGVHILHVRTINSNGTWSEMENQVFVIYPTAPGANNKITNAEYFFDSPDPGIGASPNVLNFATPADVANETFNIPVNGLTTGDRKSVV